MKITKCTFALILITTFCKAQSFLLFENVKDSTNIYQLPLSKFPVSIKLTDSIPFKAVIDGVSDSSLIVRVYKNSKAIDSSVNKLQHDHNLILSQQKRKRKYRDSLNKDLDSRILAIKYSTIKEFEIKRIKTITIYNRYFPEKKKQIKLANAAAIVFLAATLVSSSTQNPYYIGAGIGLTTIAFIAKSSLSTKDLDLIVPKRAKKRKQWRIKSLKTN